MTKFQLNVFDLVTVNNTQLIISYFMLLLLQWLNKFVVRKQSCNINTGCKEEGKNKRYLEQRSNVG